MHNLYTLKNISEINSRLNEWNDISCSWIRDSKLLRCSFSQIDVWINEIPTEIQVIWLSFKNFIMIPKLSGNTKDPEELKQSFTMNNGVGVLNTT